MLTLYHNHMSTCSQKVRLCLAEKGLEFQAMNIDLSGLQHLTAEYLKINPNGLVPALVHDGETIVESTVICEYLDEVFPGIEMVPATALGRARMRAWLRFVDETPSMAVRVPTFQNFVLPSYQKMSAEEFDALVRRMPIRRQFVARMGQDGFSQAEQDIARDQLLLCVDRMEKLLDRANWLMGEGPGVADYCTYPVLNRMEEVGMAAMWDDCSGVTDWIARIRARPAHAATFYPEARLSAAA